MELEKTVWFGEEKWLNWAILGWVCSLKVSSLVSKDSRRYSDSHQKTRGESKTKLLIHSATWHLHVHPFFFVRKISPVTKCWGGNIHRDAWGFLGQLGFSSLNLELALWQDRFFAENMDIQDRLSGSSYKSDFNYPNTKWPYGFHWGSNNPTW